MGPAGESRTAGGPRTGRSRRVPLLLASAALVAFVQLRVGLQLLQPLFGSYDGRAAPKATNQSSVLSVDDGSEDNGPSWEVRRKEMFQATHSNVTLTYFDRMDRMGNRIQLTLGAWALSRLKGWNFCSPEKEHMSQAFGFPPCHDQWRRQCPSGPSGCVLTRKDGRRVPYVDDYKGENVLTTNVSDSYYRISLSWKLLVNNDLAHSVWDQRMVDDFRALIDHAQAPQENSSAASSSETMWVDRDAAHIAVNVRRGDLYPHWRAMDWIDDDVFLQLIRWTRRYALRRRNKVEVHLFSEDYGFTNWTRYEHEVDKFHLAPKLSDNNPRALREKAATDLTLNIRDWKHFASADILIVGGTFSGVAAMSRPEPGTDGFPLTLYWRDSKGYLDKTNYFPKWWVPWYQNGTAVVVNTTNLATQDTNAAEQRM